MGLKKKVFCPSVVGQRKEAGYSSAHPEEKSRGLGEFWF